MLKLFKGEIKGENGVLTIYGGFPYSGAITLSLKTAVRFCDVVLFSPSSYSFSLELAKLRVEEAILSYDLERCVRASDSILIGVGMEKLDNFERFLRFSRIYKEKKFIIDGGGLYSIKAPLTSNFLLTPNIKEFNYLKEKFSVNDEEGLAKKLGCVVLRKGKENILTDGKRKEVIRGGNNGLTKAGTGDVLASLISAFSTQNPLWESAFYGLKIILKASEVLYKQKGPFFKASELIEAIPFVIRH